VCANKFQMFNSDWCTYQMSIRYTAGVCWQSRYE
jgi:hypothetical protein